MSKAVLISIKPRWCRKITNAEKIKIFPRDKTIEVKTIEVRKTRPKIELPFPCYIYCTKGTTTSDNLWITDLSGYNHLGNGKVIGEFVCDTIFPLSFYVSDTSYFDTEPPFTVPGTCLTDKEIAEYLGNGKTGYGWHISDLKIYDEPKELSEFGLKRAPQSWCYVEKENEID